MRDFAALFVELDESNRQTHKVRVLSEYFLAAAPADAAWALALLLGRRPKRPIKVSLLLSWAAEAARIPEWLFAESYEAVGDFAETISLVLPDSSLEGQTLELHHAISELSRLAGAEEADQKETVLGRWQGFGKAERLVYTKLMTGGFRVGVGHGVVVKALALALGMPEPIISQRLMGDWRPSASFWEQLASDRGSAAEDKPYPFCLAHPLEGGPENLGDPAKWQAEWKWDGIRCQLIKRAEMVSLWSRGEELMTERFPEIAEAAAWLPDGLILDGEVLAWKDGRPLPFGEMQRRIGRKNLSPKFLAEVPVRFLAFDVLEHGSEDLRERELSFRRARLEELELSGSLGWSPALSFADLATLSNLRQQAREVGAEGLMLKKLDSKYEIGRKKGAWWKWKLDPFSVDCVLMYAMRGSGRRASLYTDYTFGVWQNGELTPIAKAYSGLTDKEIAEVDAFVKANTLEKFGPVRTVKPELVMEIGFEAIQLSTRHKSGIAVRFPRILRWRKDKAPGEAETLERVKALLAVQ